MTGVFDEGRWRKHTHREKRDDFFPLSLSPLLDRSVKMLQSCVQSIPSLTGWLLEGAQGSG